MVNWSRVSELIERADSEHCKALEIENVAEQEKKIMCKYKELKKPNHWRIVLFLENKKTILDFQEREYNETTERIKIKDRFTVPELSKELNMDKSLLRKYLKELEKIGLINTCKFKGQIEVIL